jgi:hypothetical protein
MKHTFKNCAAQGDVYILRIGELPSGLKPVQPTKGKYILAHSETGHHHVMEASPQVKFYATDNPLVGYLEVIEATDQVEALLEHMRDFDTHAPIAFAPGVYKIINQRESAPEGWRRAAD